MIYPYVFCAAGTLFFYTGPSAMELSRQDGMEWRKELRLREGHSKDVTCFRAVGLGHSMQRLCYCLMQEQMKAVLVHYLPEEAASGGKSEGGITSDSNTSDSEESLSECEARAQQSTSQHYRRSPAAPKVLPIKGTSRFRGVSWDKQSEKWRVRVFHRLKHHHVGHFDNEEEAARAWDREALRVK
jgi:hypothetical protein